VSETIVIKSARWNSEISENSFACGNHSLLLLYFRLFQWRLGARYRLAIRAVAWLPLPLVQPWLAEKNRKLKGFQGLG